MPAEALVFLFIALAIITLVGHAIWVIIAAAVRLLFGPTTTRESLRIPCPWCQRATSAAQPRCEWCGLAIYEGNAIRLADLAATRRQLQRWQETGRIKPEAAEKLLGTVQAERQALLELPAARHAPGAAAVSPPAESPIEAIVVEPVAAKRPAVEEPIARPAPATPPAAPKPVSKPPLAPPAAGAGPAPALPRRPARPAKPKPPVAPRPPRKTWAELLHAFLEEREIPVAELLGVLLGGLLIVGASVILVISFWETLQEYPVLKFTASAAAILSGLLVGLYAHHRWQLQTTGRGLLAISLLLVPLGYLSVAGFGDQWTVVAAEAASIGLFAYVVTLAGRVFVPDRPWHLAAAILGPTASIVVLSVAPRLVAGPWALAGFGAAAAAVFGVPVVLHRRVLAALKTVELETLIGAFTLLGASLFSLSFSLGLAGKLGAGSIGSVAAAADWLSIGISIAAAMVLAFALTLNQRLAGRAGLASWRAAATAVALASILGLVGGLAMAWPLPKLVLAVALLDTCGLAWIAFQCRFPWAHGGAIATGAVAWLVGYHWISGGLPAVPSDGLAAAMIRTAAGGASGPILAVFCGLLAGAAAMLARAKRAGDARVYAIGAGVAAVVSLSASAWAAGDEGGRAVPMAMAVFGAYGAASLAVNGWIRLPALAHAGLALLTGSLAWGLYWIAPTPSPVWIGALGIEALGLALAACGLGRLAGGTPSDTKPLVTAKRLVDAYRMPVVDMADIVAALTVAAAAVVLLPKLDQITGSPWTVAAFAAAAAAWLVNAWTRTSPERTWIGSGLVFLGLAHSLVYNYPSALREPWLDAALLHATLAVAAPLATRFGLTAASQAPQERITRVFLGPVSQSALVSSTLALPLLLVSSWDHALNLSLCLFWLSAIWLVVAAMNRWPGLVTAAQAVICLASVTAASAWMKSHPWNASGQIDFLDLRTWQTYGASLAIVCLGWAAARAGLRRFEPAARLIDPEWPSLDRVVAGALCGAQLLVAAGAVIPAIGHEMGSVPATFAAAALRQAASPAAWLLWGGLAATCAVAAWSRWREADLAAGLILLGTAPWLGGAAVGSNLDAASALRWASAAALAAATALVACRRPLERLATAAGARIEIGPSGPRLARAIVLLTTLVPVLAITVLAALLPLSGTPPAGPAAGSFFSQLAPASSYLVPLLVSIAALVVLAWRESSSGYAFSAGLVAQLSAGLACWMPPVGRLGAVEWALVWYSVAITGAAWATAWMVARRWVDVWREQRPGRASLLMRLQLGIGAAAAGLVLVPGLFGLLFDLPTSPSSISAAAGGWLGWLAFLAVVGATVFHQLDVGRPVPADVAGLAGLALIGLAACTVAALSGPLGLAAHGQLWGFHMMMLGWAAYAVMIAIATWWLSAHVHAAGAEGPPQALVRAANVWVIASGALAVLLGLVAAGLLQPKEEGLWAAAAIGLAAAAAASMGVWRRQEAWAFVAGLGVNLAASLTVSYYRAVLDDWSSLLLLVEANVIAGAAVALAWLGVGNRLSRLQERQVWSGPLLALQIALTSAGAAAIVAPALVALLTLPGELPAGWLMQIGSGPGAVAVGLAFVAAGWYLSETRPRRVIHAIGGGLGAAGVLLGAGSLRWTAWFALDEWLPYHVMIAFWSVAALLLLAVGAAVGRAGSRPSARPALARLGEVFQPESARLWHFGLALSAVVAGLAWCGADPQRPYWAGGLALAAALGAGGAAIWRRHAEDVLLSGLLVNVAGTVAWLAWREHPLAGLVETNAICLAAAAILWTIAARLAPARVARLPLGEREVCFAELAVHAALVLLAGLAAVLVTLDLEAIAHPIVDRWTWTAIVAVALALVLRLAIDRSPRWLMGLYCLGLFAVACGLDARAAGPGPFCWLAGPELAGYALAAAAAFGLLRSGYLPWAGEPAGEEGEEVEESGNGFVPAQFALAATAGVLAIATALTGSFDALVRPGLAWLGPGRWSGPLAAAALLPAAWLMARGTSGRFQAGWRYAALAAAALLLATVGWAWLPAADVNMLNQTAVLMVAAILMVLVAGVVLPRIAAEGDPWAVCGRRMTAGLGGLAGVALAAILIQEAWLFEPEGGAPMATWSVVCVTAALAGLIVALLTFAVSPARDPLRLSGRGRTFYVYASEAIGGLIALHLYLAEPNLFQLGLMEQYWMLLVIGIAFLGAGLSEWFHRLGMPVLGEPLANTAVFLPLVPAVGYWIPSQVHPASSLAGSSPAVWFFASLFYGVLAATKRSKAFSFLALGSLSAAFCLLWQRMDLGLAEHVQLYGIPIGLAILVAEQIHHRELPGGVAAGMRYMALSFVYLTSSAEFLWEIGRTPWMPLALVALAVLGVLAGVFLRIRSFVIVGFTSLALVIVSLIYYAGIDQQHTWVLGVSLLLLGIAIFAFFMVFEKKKPQILETFERFWNWQRRDLLPGNGRDLTKR